MLEYTKTIKPHKKLKNGYIRFTDMQHPLADKCGIVYLHRHIASIKIGRWLLPEEDAHHVDEVKTNNAPDNLVVMSHDDHRSLHKLKRGLYKWQSIPCEQCGEAFLAKKRKSKYCSPECAQLSQRMFNIDKEELERKVWEKPTMQIAQDLGISDVAIAKRCKRLGISKPPRGYWAKKQMAS